MDMLATTRNVKSMTSLNGIPLFPSRSENGRVSRIRPLIPPPLPCGLARLTVCCPDLCTGCRMAEVIADLPYRIVDPNGAELFASVVGAQRADGEWEGWIEFVPLDESDVLVTPTETTQSNR